MSVSVSTNDIKTILEDLRESKIANATLATKITELEVLLCDLSTKMDLVLSKGGINNVETFTPPAAKSTKKSAETIDSTITISKPTVQSTQPVQSSEPQISVNKEKEELVNIIEVVQNTDALAKKKNKRNYFMDELKKSKNNVFSPWITEEVKKKLQEDNKEKLAGLDGDKYNREVRVLCYEYMKENFNKDLVDLTEKQ